VYGPIFSATYQLEMTRARRSGSSAGPFSDIEEIMSATEGASDDAAAPAEVAGEHDRLELERTIAEAALPVRVQLQRRVPVALGLREGQL